MIEIQNIQPIQKGSLLAACDVYIKPWHLTLYDVKLFEKGAQRWVAMPSKELVSDTGAKTYKEMLKFDDCARKRFHSQVVEAVDAYLLGNPDLKVPDVIVDEELPF